MAIAAWFTFVLECRLERAPAGGWRASACSRPPEDDGSARYEEGPPRLLLADDAIRVERRVVIPSFGLVDRLRDRVSGPRRVEDVFAIALGAPLDVREGDALRVCRDSMGRREARLSRRGPDGRAVVVWSFEDPRHPMTVE